jgi:flagellar basal body P-ring formation protein FlgA
MRWLFAGAMLALAPVNATAKPISGAEVVALVRKAMQQQGLAAPDIAAPLRAFPPCAHDPIVTPRNGAWAQAQLECTAPQWWQRVVRTDAAPRAISTDAPSAQDDAATGLILVATRPLLRGQRISADDVRLVQGSARLGSLDATAQIEGRRLRVALMPDQPVLERHLDPDFDIASGQDVSLRLNSGGIEIGITAVAQEQGWIGDTITVKPWNSGRTVQVQIIAKGVVQVAPNISASAAVNR